MSKLSEMIATLCPNGVEYKKLGEVAEIGTGSSNRNESSVDGQYPFFVRSKQIERMDSYEFDEEAIIIPGEGGIGEIFHYVNGKYALHQRVYRIHLLRDDICAMFVYYYLTAHFKQFILSKAVTATVTSIRKPMIEKFSIPLPPLPIQREIVQILDNFANLTAELTAELAKRKKQYEHYRDMLLNFTGGGRYDKFGNESGSSHIEWKRLGEIATDMYRGSGILRTQVTEMGVPCVRYGEIYTAYGIWFDRCISHTKMEYVQSPKFIDKGDILFAITGESVEEIAKSTAYIGEERCLAGGDIVVMKHNQDPKYLSYALSTVNAQRQKSKGKVKSKVVHSSVPAIKDILIPLPPLAEQKRIVDILDRFDSLCNSLTEGLPAEIALRKQQYEYYRDKLLSFKEAS